VSDYSGKYRPALERIACLVGRGGGMPGSGAGIPGITDHDIAHAITAARQCVPTSNPKESRPSQSCVRPELLELHWGGNMTRAPRIARMAASHVYDGKDRDLVRLSRLAAVMAAQHLGGDELSQARLKDAAWIIGTDYRNLEPDCGRAIAWMQGELNEAEHAFCDALNRIQDARPTSAVRLSGMALRVATDHARRVREEKEKALAATLESGMLLSS